jgi:cell wall-associated NlpC family hydrolase
MAELVYALDLGSSVLGRESSNLSTDTQYNRIIHTEAKTDLPTNCICSTTSSLRPRKRIGMNRNRLVATLLSGLITLGILGLPTNAQAAPITTPQASVAQLETKEEAKVSTSAVSNTAPSDSWVSVTPYPSRYGSLANISQAFYGSPGHWPGLCQTNGLADCNLIYVGQSIKVPASVGTAPQVQQSAPATNGNRAQAIVNYGLAQVGKPYRWAAAGPGSYDCSGLVMMALRQVGISVPHQDQSILYNGQGWRVSRANLQPGDIVWPHVGHVAIYIGNGRIVHAAGYRYGVITGNLYSFLAAKRYV